MRSNIFSNRARLIVSQLFIGLTAAQSFAANPVWEPYLNPQKNMLSAFSATPDFTRSQFYKSPAPVGVGVELVREHAGSRGEYVKIIDIETSFAFKHEDLGDVFHNNGEYRTGDHGTAVLGILRGIDNAFGVTGISPQSQLGFFGFPEGDLDDVTPEYILGINRSIKLAIEKLDAGDVLVIEQHMVGPDQRKYTAVEYWPEIFQELKNATDKGIICVAAAGNGNSNFDDAAYEGAFDLKVRDSGCILVGAGAPNTHDRLSFSNYGSRIDAHGYGRGVTTTGYGDLFSSGVLREYTSSFSGTSSATPIVAGAVAVVSSIAKAKGRVIDPKTMRAALRNTGTPQGAQTKNKNIGSFPDIPALLNYLELN